MSIYLQQLLTKVVIHRTEVAKKKWKLRARFSHLKENCEHQTKISTKRDKDGFSPAVFRSRLEQKTPVTECFVCCVCALFSMAKSMSRMGSSVRFCCHNMMIFRWFLIIFSPRSHREVSLQVAHFLRDCKGIVVEPVSQRIWNPIRRFGPPYQTFLLSIVHIIFGN